MIAHAATLVAGFCVALSGSALASAPIQRRAISQALMDNLERFTQFSSAAYQLQLLCPAPLGTTMVQQVRSFTSLYLLPETYTPLVQ